MLKGYKILTSFCVICATLYGGAYGAASVRGGATSRAGSIRTLGAGTTASVKTTTSRTQPTTTAANANTESTESVGGMRMSHATGLGGSKLPGKISGTTTSTSGDNQNVAELRQAIEQLRNDYDALGEQYNNLLGDVSNVSDTAQVAHETATNNTNTLTVVRSDLSVAKSDIEDLKATGGFDEERVQEALDTTLAQRNYATRGELAATDAVARGAVQVADLPQTLNALNIADKDYVASRTQGVVNDSLNITLENYYTKGQVNAAIDVAKTGMVDKNYVDNQIDGLAPKTYVDNRVASIQTGVSEGAVQGIINNSIDTRLGNYYTKGDIDDAIVDAIGAAKDGMADRDYVNTQVRDTMEYVDTKVAEIESGVDAGTLYNILETRGYKTGTEVQGIVNDSINNTMANYYTKGQVDGAINTAKKGMVDKNYVDFLVDGLVDENRVNTIVNTKIATLPLGLDQNAVKAVVEGYGYKDDAAVRNILAEYNYAKADDIPNMIAELAPGADIQYDNGVLTFKDKNGNQQTVDIRGLDGQDGAQVELQKNGDKIQWRYESDTAWHDLVNVSDLRGADGKSVELGVQTMTVEGMPIKDALVYKKDGENNWQFLYNLDNIAGADGCGIKVETNDYVSGGALLGKTVKLLRDCPASSLDGAQLTSFNVLNGADGTVSEEQIIDALESDETFKQLKTKVANLETNQSETYNLAMGVSDAVENPETGLAATNTLASKAWNKVKDLDPNVTTKDYVDSYVNGKIGDLDYDPTTYGKFASVAAKLGSIGNKTMKDYVDEKVRGVTTEINVDKGDDGFTYICKNGNACTSKPNSWDNQWERIDVDLSGYLNKETADSLYASFGTEVMARDAATAAAAAQTTANKAWGKLDDLGNKTVKSYVEDVVGVGSLGINPLTGVSYTVAGKLGFGQGTATQTVKEYIDEKFRSVNTEIMIADGPDGLMYICRKGNTCTTPAGPSNSHEWAAVSVDMSDYLKESDAEREFAKIAALNGVQTTANEAKTAATTAQTSATQAQNAASAAQSTANDAWSKLSSLEGQTVKEYVEDKLSGISTEAGIQIEQYNGSTYICKKGTGCRTPVNEWRAEYEEINMDGYLTDAEAAGLYAQKSELDSYALKSYVDGNIGTLGGSFSSVADKIGLNNSNDWTNSNKSVKQYVDDKFSSISTDIQVETGTDGFTYICKTGNNCHLPIASYPNEWAKVNVDLGTLGTNPSSGQAYNVATKIGLIDSANINKTVVGYIGEQIGSLGTYYDSSTYMQKPHSVLTYLQANYTPLTKLGTEITGNTTQTVAQYITQRIGNTGDFYDSYTGQTRPKSVVEFLAGSYVPLTTIGDLGSNGYANYTVAQKIGLNTDDTKNTTVKTYVDNRVGSLGKTDGSTYATSVAAKLGNLIVNADQTVAEYIQSKIDGISRDIQVEQVGNDTYICKTGNNCSKPVLDYYPAQWAKITIDVSGYLTEDAANALYAAKTVESAVNNAETGLSATRTLASSASAAAATADTKAENAATAAATADTKAGNAATAAETAQNTANTANTTANDAWAKVKGLNEVSGLSDKTVTGYVDYRLGEISGTTVKAYVDNKVESGGVTVKTITNNGVSETYICSKNCDVAGTPPCAEGAYPSTCGWQKLEVDLSQYLKTETAENTYLRQDNIKLKREGNDIKIWGGGIVASEAYKVADVEDLMCASYRMEPLVPGDEGYDANKASFQLICNTNE